MIGVPAGKLSLCEAAQRYCTMRAQQSPLVGTDMAHQELKRAFGERDIDAFVGPVPGTRLIGWFEEPFSELNFLRQVVQSNDLWRGYGYGGQVAYVDEEGFNSWLSSPQRRITGYWTIDQALVWLTTGDASSFDIVGPSSESFMLTKFSDHEWPLIERKHAAEEDLMRALRSVEALACWNGEAVPPIWFYGAEFQTGASQTDCVLLKVNEFATIIRRRSDTPSHQSESFRSFPIEGMAPLIDAAKLVDAVTPLPLPRFGSSPRVPIGWAIGWTIHRGKPMAPHLLARRWPDAEREFFMALAQSPAVVRGSEVVFDRLELPVDGFLPGAAWEVMNEGIPGRPEFYALDSEPGGSNGPVARDRYIGGTIYHNQRRWTRIEVDRGWLLDNWHAGPVPPGCGACDSSKGETISDLDEPRQLKSTRSLADKDAPILQKMDAALKAGTFDSVWAAARHFSSEAEGSDFGDSKTRRLQRRYDKKFPK